VIGLTYSVSPVHTDAFLRRARATAMGPRAPDVDRLYLKDPGGLVDVGRLPRARPRCSSTAFAPRPVRAAQPRDDRAPRRRCTWRGARLGFGTLHTARRPGRERHVEHPSAETTIHNLEATGFAHAPRQPRALVEMSAHFRALRARQSALPLGAPGRPTTPPTTGHQMPGRDGDDDAAVSSPRCAGPSCSRPRSRSAAASRDEFRPGRSWSRRSRNSSVPRP